jgi:hypothetical protein
MKIEEDKEYCPLCNEEMLDDYKVDTEGLINGGIGIICEQCWEDRRC